MTEWQHLYPWAIAMLLNYPELQGVSTVYGVDNHVAQVARRCSKATGGFESPDEHVRVFSDMHMIEGEVYLLHAPEAQQRFQLNVAAWKSGDTNPLYAIHAKEMKEAPTVWWRLLDRRNANWVPRLDSTLKAGIPTLVVAVALNFSGPRSVIARSQRRGYKIEQL